MNPTIQPVERYCVFQSDDRWFGITALAVRNIIPRPELTRAPQSDPIMKGICHVQNEFLPVVSMRALTQIQYDTAPQIEQQLMTLLGPQGPWGLLIDQVHSLQELEASISTFSGNDDKWDKVVLASASWQNEVLQVLEPNSLYLYAQSLMDSFWANANPNETLLAGN